MPVHNTKIQMHNIIALRDVIDLQEKIAINQFPLTLLLKIDF
jgi:hypothetical protein